MPQEIFIPSKNKTLTFADDFSEQEIADYIDSNFPRTGEDVSYDLKNRLLDREWNPSYDDFEKLRDYNKSKNIDTLEVVGNIFSGAVEMGKNLLAAIPATVTDPAAIPGSMVRALKNNIDNYALLGKGGTDPGSKLFQLMNGDSPTAYSTWREAIEAARNLNDSSNAAIGGMRVNPQQVRGLEVVEDPLMIAPIPGSSAIGKAAGAAGRGVARAAGYATENIGRAITGIASVPERMVAKAASSLAGVSEEAALRATEGAATTAAVAGALSGAVPEVAAIKAAKLGGAVTEAAGEAAGAVAARMGEGPGILSVTEKALQNPNLSTGARAMLTVAQRVIPRDAAVIAAEGARAGAVGAALGGGLGYLQTTDEEELGRAIGGGLAAGAMLGGGLKLWDKATGRLAKERSINDASRFIDQLAQAGETPENVGAAAELMSRLGEMDRKGEGLGTFLAMNELISQRGGKVKVVDGDIVKGPGGETGWNAYFDPKDKTIYINSKSADVTTLPHEAVHSFVADRLADDITARIFTRDADGRLQQTVPGSEIAKLIEGYLKDADNVKLSDGTTEGQRLRERLDAAFDPATPTSEQVSRLRDITHEITARYAEDWVKKKSPRDFLPGAIPTIWSEAISAVRGKLDQTFGRSTGNPILDPVLKRIFDPKETGVPERAVVPLDPKSLAYDWSDKKGMFMTRYTSGSPAKAEKHWREVTKVVEPILKAAGGETPESAYYSKNNISLRNVGEDVINSLTTRNIETDLRSSAPIMGAREAEITNMLIRAMKTGELIDLRDYMSFLNEGKAESGKAREGNPVDKRVAIVDVFWNKDNGVQALAVDIGSAMSRLAKAVKAKGDASGFTSVAEAQSALSQYLRHVADSETNFDAAKKGWEIEIGGRPMGKTAHKTLHEALGVPDSGKNGLPPFRPDIAIGREGINRTSGIEFVLPRRVTGQAIQTGVITPISNKGVDAVQRRFQPERTQVEQLPNGSIAKDADGARVVQVGTSGFRLFDPLGEKVGVYRSLEDAAKAATKQASQDLANVKEVQYAIQEQRAKEISVRQRASNREAVRQGDTQRQEAARTRFQPQKEEAYLKAVERGDTETAQRMVDEAAKAAGYKTVFAFHGTPVKEQINVFSTAGKGKTEGAGLFLSSNESVANTYAGKSGRVYKVYLKLQNPLEINGRGEWWGNLSKGVLSPNGVDSPFSVADVFGFQNAFTDAIGRKLDKTSFDSAVIRNIQDVGTKKVVGKAKLPPSDIYIVKDPSQLKSAEATTYDNNGNVIPLSQRFDTSSPDIRFQPKRKGEKPLPKTPFGMQQEIAAESRAAKKADVAAVRGRIERRGTGNLEAERMAAMEAQAREAELFAKPKRAVLSDEQIAAIRESNITRTYVESLLGYEKAYTALTGEPPVGKAYQENPIKMTKRQQDSILRLAMSSDLPQAKLAIEAAREAADPAMRAAIERMLGAQERTAALPKAEQTLGVEDVKRSLQTVLPQDFGAPEIRGRLESRQAIRRQVEGAMRDVRAQGEAEAAQMRQATEAKFDEAASGVAQEAAKVSAEIADQFKALKKEIAAADEVISSETDAINPARIILKMKGKYRLYGANAGLIGVFRTKEEAVKKASKK